MHIAMIGGSGRVGSVALNYFCQQYASAIDPKDKLRITLHTHNKDNAQRLLGDLQQTLFAIKQTPFTAIDLIPSNQYENLSQADLVVMLASNHPTKQQEADYLAKGIEHRPIYSMINRDLMIEASRQILIHAPKAKVLIVTNQSDLNAAIVRKYLPAENVLGFGGIVDSNRFRMQLATHMQNAGRNEADAQEAIRGCHIVGYHNSDMNLLSDSLKMPDISPHVIEAALKHTREEGYRLTMLGRDTASDSTTTTPYMMPGCAVAQTMAAFAGLAPLTGSFNVVLDKTIANQYGVPEGTALSVPVTIERGQVTPLSGFTATTKERKALLSAARKMSSDYHEVVSPKKPKGRPATIRHGLHPTAASLQQQPAA